MIKRDIKGFAESNWSNKLKPISIISLNKDTMIPLVDSQELLYDFDVICNELFPNHKLPASVDGLSIPTNKLELVEFKSGFKQHITKSNFDQEKGKCKHIGKVCDYYWDLFFENQQRKIKELIASIRFKAIESYYTMEKYIFPQCDDVKGKPIQCNFYVVIDEDGIESMEDTLAELSGTQVDDNCFEQIRKALSMLKDRTDVDGNQYLYDNIYVLSKQDYINHISIRS